MSAFHADLAALEDLLDRLAAFDRRAGTVAADLDTDARRLADQWAGAAAQRQTDARRRWAQAHEELRRAAGELAVLVRTAHANYAAAAGANSRMWG